MGSASKQAATFEEAKARLEQIADAVGNDDMPLDEALDLFEEAVALGLAVSDLVEEGIVVEDESASDAPAQGNEAANPENAQAQSGADQAGAEGAGEIASE